MTTITEPCRCWTTTSAMGHDGHCCWSHPGDTYELGSLPPCGHWHPSVPRPAGCTNPPENQEEGD